uniref:IMS_C domain-containing protein n=1 Tax=Globodera pallida TaxID=36090 RepID=A0A183CPH6_GLOPA
TNEEPICPNLQPKSLGVSKNFAGANMLTTIMAVRKWIQALCNELSKRLAQDDDKYGRVAQTLVIGFTTGVGEHNVRTLHLPNYTTASIQQTCWNFMKPFNREKDGLTWCVVVVGGRGVVRKNFPRGGGGICPSERGAQMAFPTE